MVASLRRRLGRQLAGHGGPAPHARVRADPRATGCHSRQQPRQCRVEPQGDLHRSDVDRGLSRGAHDHHATVPLRLRRSVRRVDRCDRLAPRLRSRPRPPRRPDQCPRHGAAGASELGPVRRHDLDGRPRRGRLHVGTHRAETLRRRHGPALRWLLHHHRRLARGARLLWARRERGVRRGRGEHSRATACCRSTPTVVSSRAGACTASASFTRPASSCAARVAGARSSVPVAGNPRSLLSPTAAARSPAPCC